MPRPRLDKLISAAPPVIPTALGGLEALNRVVASATESVRKNIDVVEGLQPDKLGELKSIPEATRPALSDLINTWCPVQKIFVAVHGIGDQFQGETVQSVAYRVCDYVGVPAAMPLGRFHGPGGTVTKAYIPDPDRDPPIRCGFAEIYWANVPRIPAADKHILEEPKKWARTLVQRLRLREAVEKAGVPARTRDDDERLEQVIAELIQGVIVTDRVAFLADKAGLFKLDLNQLKNDNLNDVQVVTEFEDYRRQLLEIFADVLEKLHRYLPKSEVYIVAHSEGTVVAFMGLLKGLSGGASWAKSIRGFMTIGSPLNKHVRFWPELFDRYKSKNADQAIPPIPWKNYYDFGDPIGFNLQQTREWMKQTKWSRFFAFRDEDGEDDIGFTRYYFPGKAHNDYWSDPEVFGHFIAQVVDRTSTVLRSAQAARFDVPGTKVLAWLTSYLLPYAMASGLLFLACYLIYKAVRGNLDPIGARFETPVQIFENVLGLFGLIAGMSLIARIPRLTRKMAWRFLAFVLAAIFTSLYIRVFPENRYSMERIVTATPGNDPFFNDYNRYLLWALLVGTTVAVLVKGLRPVLLTLLPVVLIIFVLRVMDAFLSGVVPATGLLDRPVIGPWLAAVPWRSLELIAVAWCIGYRAWKVSWAFPEVGTKPLIHTGGLLILMMVITQFVFSSRGLSDEEKVRVNQGVARGDRLAIARAVDEKAHRAFLQVAELARDSKVKPSGPDAASGRADDRCCESDAEQAVARASEMQAVTDAALAQGPIWPVFLGGAAFLYVWWLAVVLFDLTFVWHLYIRWSGAQKYIEKRLPALE